MNKNEDRCMPTAKIPIPIAKRNLVSKRQLAAELGVTKRTVDSWIARKLVPYFKIAGCRVYFDRDVVAKALIREVKP